MGEGDGGKGGEVCCTVHTVQMKARVMYVCTRYHDMKDEKYIAINILFYEHTFYTKYITAKLFLLLIISLIAAIFMDVVCRQ